MPLVNNLNMNAFLGAAVLGVISAAGMYLVEHYRQEKSRHKMAKDLARLDHELGQVRRELDQLLAKKRTKPHKAKGSNKTVRKENSIITSEDYMSTSNLDSSDLEFYDLSDDEPTITSSTHLGKELKIIDEILDVGSLEQLEDALEKLKDLCIEYPEQTELLWRIGKAHHKIADCCDDINFIKQHVSKEHIITENGQHMALWNDVKIIGKEENKQKRKLKESACILLNGDDSIASCSRDIDRTWFSLLKTEQINGIEACEHALKLKTDCPNIHKWYAILVGSRSEYVSLQDKISDGHLFKKHVDAAITLNPTDPSLHHMLGRFDYEIAELKWYERKVATALFGEPPNATYSEALEHFFEAERLANFEWKENKMMIAKCKVASREYKEAVEWLEKADACRQADDQDDKIDREVKVLLEKYINYT